MNLLLVLLVVILLTGGVGYRWGPAPGGGVLGVLVVVLLVLFLAGYRL
jgi:hypothetical protein